MGISISRCVIFGVLLVSALPTMAGVDEVAPDPPPPDLCFAAGTSEAYMEHVMLQALGQARRSSVAADGTWKYRFEDAERWSQTATNGSGLSQGDPTTLTWGIVPDGTSLPSGAGEPAAPSNLQTWMVTVFGSVANGLAVLQAVFDRWEELSGVSYVYEPNDNGSSIPDMNGALGVKADIRIGGHAIDGSWNVFAFAYYPDWGDIVIDTNDSALIDATNNYHWLRNAVAHESGHSIGIHHVCPNDETKLMEPLIDDVYDGPQHDEILAVVRGYGDPMEHNDTAGTASALGALDNTVVNMTDSGLDDDTDVDYYGFTLAAPAVLDAALTPVGQTYHEGPYQGGCGATSPYNSLDNHDLSLEILDASETVIASADINPAGAAEVLTDVVADGSGTFYVRVSTTSTSDEPQLYTLDVGAVNAELIFSDGFESGDTTRWSAN